MKFPEPQRNNPERAGALASKKVRFGAFGRFALFAVHTRFDAVCWFVADGERMDESGFAAIIRQEATPAAAVAGLPIADPIVD